MEKDTLDFIEQFLDTLEKNLEKLEKAKEEKNPRRFNEVKKDSYQINEEIRKLIR